MKENVPKLHLFEDDIKGNIHIEFDSSRRVDAHSDSTLASFSMFKENAQGRMHSTKLSK